MTLEVVHSSLLHVRSCTASLGGVHEFPVLRVLLVCLVSSKEGTVDKLSRHGLKS